MLTRKDNSHTSNFHVLSAADAWLDEVTQIQHPLPTPTLHQGRCHVPDVPDQEESMSHSHSAKGVAIPSLVFEVACKKKVTEHGLSTTRIPAEPSHFHSFP
jgi:hypothetical protein